MLSGNGIDKLPDILSPYGPYRDSDIITHIEHLNLHTHMHSISRVMLYLHDLKCYLLSTNGKWANVGKLVSCKSLLIHA